jgi:hypothetical protein
MAQTTIRRRILAAAARVTTLVSHRGADIVSLGTFVRIYRTKDSDSPAVLREIIYGDVPAPRV